MTNIQPTTPVENDNDNDNGSDLDLELEAVFDENHETTNTQPQHQTIIPESPERRRRNRNVDDDNITGPKSILHALVARKESHRLTSHAAAIAREVEQSLAVAASSTTTNRQTPSVTNKNPSSAAVAARSNTPTTTTAATPTSSRLSKTLGRKRDASTALLDNQNNKNNARNIKNAFRVIGKDSNNSKATNNCTVNEPNITNMSLRRAPMSANRLNALFETIPRIDISELDDRCDDIRAGRVKEWITFGTLVKKHGKRETRDGSGKFAVWTICNMPRWPLLSNKNIFSPTSITLLLFDEAFTSFHMLPEGSAVGLRKPFLLPPRASGNINNGEKDRERGGSEWCGYCLRLNKKDQLVSLGICTDFALCTQPNGSGNSENCSIWYDKNRMDMCFKHTQRKQRRLMRGNRMDINNAERPIGRNEAEMIQGIHNGAVKDLSRADRSGAFGTATSTKGNMSGGWDETIEEDRRRKQAEEKLRANGLMKASLARRNAMHERSGPLKNTLSELVAKSRSFPRHKQNQPQPHVQQHPKASLRGKEFIEIAHKQHQEKHENSKRKAKGQMEGERKKKLESKYLAALDILTSIGFQITIDGDVLAPEIPNDDIPLELKKGKAPSLRERNIKTTLSPSTNGNENGGAKQLENDLCLSEESESE